MAADRPPGRRRAVRGIPLNVVPPPAFEAHSPCRIGATDGRGGSRGPPRADHPILGVRGSGDQAVVRARRTAWRSASRRRSVLTAKAAITMRPGGERNGAAAYQERV